MKIHDIEYNWNKAYKLDEGEQGCVYRVWCNCYFPMNKTIAYVTDIFSGAVAVLGELNTEANIDILDEIVDRLSRDGSYTDYDFSNYTYYIEPIDIWKLESVE